MKRILHHVLFLFCYIIIFSCSSPFERQHTYDVSVSSLVGGKVVVNGSQFQIGQEVGISILPDIGYKILEGSLHYTKNGKKFAIPAGQFSMPAASIVISCEFVSKYETILTLDKTNATFIGNMTLTAKITTNAPTTPKLIWSSSDPAAISVDNEQQRFVHHPDGTVSVTVDIIVGIQNKSAVITATTDTGKIEARCTVLELAKDIFDFVQSGDTNNPYTITKVNKLVRNDEETFYFPDVIDGKPVTKIGNGTANVFKDFQQHEVRIYKNIFIPASVKNIAIGTFSLFDRVETINVYAKNPPDIGNMKEVFNTASLKEIYVGGDPNDYRVKWALYKRYIIGFGQNKITISDKIAIEGGGRIEVESVTATPGNIVKLIVMADDDKELDLSPTGGVYASFVKPGTSETEMWVFYNPYFVMPSADVTLYVKFIKRVEGVTMTPESYRYQDTTEVCNFRTYYKDGDQTTVILDVFNTTRDAPTVVVPGYDINAVAVKDTTTGNAIIGGVTSIPLPSDLPDDQKLFARYEIKKLRTALITVTVTWKKLTTIVTLYESKEAKRGKIGNADGKLGTVNIEYGTLKDDESDVVWVASIPPKFDKKSLLGFELAEGSVPVAERKLYFTYSQGENSGGKIKLALTDGWTINEKEIKLYAKWLGKSFSVEFYPDVSSSVSKAIELEYDKPITATTLAMITGAGDFNTLKRGYDFLGFYTDATPGSNKEENVTAPNSSMLYFKNKDDSVNGDITLVNKTWGNNASEDSTLDAPTKLYGFWEESVWDGKLDASPEKEPKVNDKGVYEIWRPSEFVSLALRASLLKGKFIQMKDLKFDYTTIPKQHGKSMIPVGENNTFSGTYEGGTYDGGTKTHKILNLKIDSALGVVGLFGKLAGTLTNITIESGAITSNTADAIVGGIVGKVVSGATVTNCVNKAEITSKEAAAAIGGVIGEYSSSKNLTALGNEGSIKSTGASSNVGGIIGKVSNDKTQALLIDKSYNIGEISITGSGGSNVGGLIGILNGKIKIAQSYNIGSVSTSGDNVGGLVGNDEFASGISFEDVYACAKQIKGNNNVSGLVGYGLTRAGSNPTAITVMNAYLFSPLSAGSGASNALSQVAYIAGAKIAESTDTVDVAGKLYVSNLIHTTADKAAPFNGSNSSKTPLSNYIDDNDSAITGTANPFIGSLTAGNWEYPTVNLEAIAGHPLYKNPHKRWVLKGVGPADSTKR